ncbi:Gti1/Pac2 family-domain-containing protein [Fomitopsis serialis]|uniref:Gti1/Pac2 family-domain-containing protein n=1 Tax=Fomitopsis serialis TaxID=139415 RepID=UPI0020084FFA|nr:Gti1/Pac2 family-domain-containing protein [Neoantrodia serialis]KAH9930618.1 Gti1/Pac2 family-domain-containing protein [Neoantrodia serialis]
MFYDPANDVQRPTHPRLHLRDVRDAHMLFEAVRLGLIKRVQRRLNDAERSSFIQSGAVFVWEESEEETGLKRWTDGRIWSQSRMREPYLFYDEKLSQDDPDPPSGQSSRSTFRFVEGPSRTWSSSAQSHYERSEHHPTGLVKQAYSAWVLTAPNTRPRKWHLTAYFTYADLPNIPTVDRDPTLRNITVPQGVYRSGKSRTRNPDAGPVPYSLPALHSATHSLPGRPGTPVILPPPNADAAPGQGEQSGSPRRSQPRRPEDERMIRLLNSKPF